MKTPSRIGTEDSSKKSTITKRSHNKSTKSKKSVVNSDYLMPKESSLDDYSPNPNAFKLNDVTVLSTADVTPQNTVPQTGEFKQYIQ